MSYGAIGREMLREKEYFSSVSKSSIGVKEKDKLRNGSVGDGNGYSTRQKS